MNISFNLHETSLTPIRNMLESTPKGTIWGGAQRVTIPFNMGHRKGVIVRVQGCRKGDGPTVEKVRGL